MLGIIIGAVVLIAAMYLVGRHEADTSLPKALMIATGVGMSMWILAALIGLFALPVGFVLTMGAVYKFCYLGWGKAAAVAGIYFVTMVGIEIGFAMLRAS